MICWDGQCSPAKYKFLCGWILKSRDFLVCMARSFLQRSLLDRAYNSTFPLHFFHGLSKIISLLTAISKDPWFSTFHGPDTNPFQLAYQQIFSYFGSMHIYFILLLAWTLLLHIFPCTFSSLILALARQLLISLLVWHIRNISLGFIPSLQGNLCIGWSYTYLYSCLSWARHNQYFSGLFGSLLVWLLIQ